MTGLGKTGAVTTSLLNEEDDVDSCNGTQELTAGHRSAPPHGHCQRSYPSRSRAVITENPADLIQRSCSGAVLAH
ncbi:hypothetical protein AAFF_G00282920 [Aldrovandia affinis]|uniref:Uncharacterized protein n=1 Tax=Aldrovandia affinis TaxID=143900 RepID=A0AAD7T9Y8_9TELE|nr:hypothetical protein AAFF_G00282920 [Aldrovandia affinis]